MAPTTVQLGGTFVLGGGHASVETAIGSKPWLLQGEVAGVGFADMVRQLCGPAFLQLPAGFPSITFETAAVAISETIFMVRATANVQWADPFGILDGLTFGPLTLAFTSQAAASLEFSGPVAYGSLQMKGALIFDGGALVIAAASFQAPLSIGEFLSRSVGGIDWGDLLPITFGPRTPGGSARIYYAQKAIDTYRTGFNLDEASIEVFGFAADVSLHVSERSDCVTVKGALQSPIDLDYLVLSGVGGASGPSVTAMACRSGNHSFSLQSAMKFLGNDFGSIKLAVQNVAGDGYQLNGSVSAGSAGPFTDAKLTFTWSPADGFRIPSWNPGIDASKVMNYVDLLNRMRSDPSCGSFVETMFNAVTTKFKLNASVAPQGLSLVFTFGGAYTISADGVGDVTFQMPTPLLVTLKPGGFSFESLGDMLLDAIGNAALSFVEGIRNDADLWLRFTAIIFAKSALKRVTSLLLCQKWPPPPPPGLPPLPPMSGGGGGGGGSSGGGGTGSLGPTTITSLIFSDDALHATWSPVNGANFYTAYLTNNQALAEETRQDSTSATFPVLPSWPATDYFFNVVACIDQDHTGPWSPAACIRRLGAPSQPVLSDSDAVLTLQWAPGSAAATYEYIVNAPSGEVFQQGSTSTTSVAMPLPAGASPGTYTAKVRATGGTSVIASVWTAPATLALFPGGVISIQNTESTSIEAQVTAPPSSETKTIDPQATLLLESSTITGFLLSKDRPATAKTELVDAFQVNVASIAGDVTLAYTDVATGHVPGGFTITARRGVLAGGRTYFSDVLTIPQMAIALRPFLTGPSDVALLFVFLYPALTPPCLAGAALSAGLDVKATAVTLVDARQHFHGITPSQAACALQKAWTAAKQPISPTDVALALLPAFAAIGQTLGPTALAKAIVAAFPVAVPVTVAGIEPLLIALQASQFDITAAAVACHDAVPALTPSILAQALRAVYQ